MPQLKGTVILLDDSVTDPELTEHLLYARSDEYLFLRSSQLANKCMPYCVEVWVLRGGSNCCAPGLMERVLLGNPSWRLWQN